MWTVVLLTFGRFRTACTIHPNLLNEDDVAYSANASLGTQKNVSCGSIVSAILASCDFPIFDRILWTSSGSDRLALHVYHICISVHALELRSVQYGVQRVEFVLDTMWS